MRSIPAAVAAVLMSVTLAACVPAQGMTTAETTRPSSPPTASAGPADNAPEPGTVESTAPPAIEVLAGLPIKGRAPSTGYHRGNFGQAWADADRNGCDTRNDVLRRDLTEVTIKAGTNGCKVTSGNLADPYSGTRIDLSDVQVDHMVALHDAWQKGAQQLTDSERLAFANDPLNLQPTSGALNQAKSSSDAASWLPPDKGYRCTYVARQVAVKAKHRLWVSQAEHDAIARILSGCPTQPAPSELPTPALASASQPEPVHTSDVSLPGPDAHELDPPDVDVPGLSAPDAAQSAGGTACDPAYPGVCIPAFDVVGDLDCGQISERRFRVEPPDPHRFDRDRDGIGCESD